MCKEESLTKRGITIRNMVNFVSIYTICLNILFIFVIYKKLI
jgi:hypothetical protein